MWLAWDGTLYLLYFNKEIFQQKSSKGKVYFSLRLCVTWKQGSHDLQRLKQLITLYLQSEDKNKKCAYKMLHPLGPSPSLQGPPLEMVLPTFRVDHNWLLINPIKKIKFISSFYIYLFSVYVHVGGTSDTCGGQKATYKSWLVPSTMWARGIKCRSSGLVASDFTHWVMSPHSHFAHSWHMNPSWSGVVLCLGIHHCSFEVERK